MEKKTIIKLLALILIAVILLVFLIIKSSEETEDAIGTDIEQELPIETEKEKEDIVNLEELMAASKLYARTGRFDKAYYIIEDKINSHDIDAYDNFGIIEGYFYDLLFLQQLQTQASHGLYDELLESVKNMSEPETFILGYLGLSYDHKLLLTYSPISLLAPPNPIIDSIAVSKLSYENDVTKDVFSIDMDLEDVYAMDITMNGNELIAYIAKNDNGFYLYELTGEAENIITINDWIEIKGGTEIYE